MLVEDGVNCTAGRVGKGVTCAFPYNDDCAITFAADITSLGTNFIVLLLHGKVHGGGALVTMADLGCYVWFLSGN